MFDAEAHATSDALVAMLAKELEQDRAKKALIEHCDKEIAKCESIAADYPSEAATMEKLKKGWRRTKQNLQIK